MASGQWPVASKPDEEPVASKPDEKLTTDHWTPATDAAAYYAGYANGMYEMVTLMLAALLAVFVAMKYLDRGN